MKSDELNMAITAHRAWNPSSAVHYLPKQNIIVQNNSTIRMRIYEAHDPYGFIKELTIQKIGKVGPVIVPDMRKEDQQDENSFTVMYYDKEMNIELVSFRRYTDEQFECGWMKEKETPVMLVDNQSSQQGQSIYQALAIEQQPSTILTQDKLISCFLVEGGRVLIFLKDAFYVLGADFKLLKAGHHPDMQHILSVKAAFSQDQTQFIVGYTSPKGKKLRKAYVIK